MQRSSKKRLAAAAATIALVATGTATVMGGHLSASEEGGGSPPPPGEQVNDIETGVEFASPVSGDDELIITGGSNFDDTILTKYIPAANFQTRQGEAGLSENDTNGEIFNACVAPGTDSGGTVTEFRAPVEVPDGARIKRIHFYGLDNDGGENIGVSLDRVQYNTPFALFPLTPVSTRTNALVNSFTTSGQQTEASVFSGDDNLAEIAGSFSTGGGFAITGTANRFHTVKVTLRNAAGDLHQLCGVRVDYQVPASTVESGSEYHPVGPIRAYDSRQGSFSPSGVLSPNSNRVVDITDGYDLDGNAVPAQADAVPTNATAVTYNITVTGVTGPNFTAVTAGDATEFTTSAINFGPGDEIANAGTVTVSNGEIKLWGGSNTGSAHVIIDITGYYAPGPLPSNMGN